MGVLKRSQYQNNVINDFFFFFEDIIEMYFDKKI